MFFISATSQAEQQHDNDHLRSAIWFNSQLNVTSMRVNTILHDIYYHT